MRAEELGLQLSGNEKAVLDKIKELDHQGFQIEDAEGTFELIIIRDQPSYSKPFTVISMEARSSHRDGNDDKVEAKLEVEVNGKRFKTWADGDGPVHALDQALREALAPAYPELSKVKLGDYKVRILNPDKATAATTRVTIEATSDGEWWTTVGCSHDIIAASFQALTDSFELFLLKFR